MVDLVIMQRWIFTYQFHLLIAERQNKTYVMNNSEEKIPQIKSNEAENEKLSFLYIFNTFLATSKQKDVHDKNSENNE